MSDPPYRLPEIPFLRLRVTLRAEEPARLPGYEGSMLRGAFGHALRRAVCAMGPEQPCATCPLRRECVHPRLFETLIEGEPPPFLKGLSTAPRPYVFEPAGGLGAAEAGGRDYAPGDPLRFDLVLFGRAVDLQAYALLAIERMAENGLGRRRCRFTLERVEHPVPSPEGVLDEASGGGGLAPPAGRHGGRPLQSGGASSDPPAGAIGPSGGGVGAGAWRTGYLRGERRWQERVPPSVPRPERLAPRLASGAADLHLLTPLRLTGDGPPPPGAAPGFDFRKLAFRTIRRALEVAHFHGVQQDDPELDWHFKPMLQAASRRVTITRHDLEWRDGERWSNRQRASMRLGGHVGRLRLEGDLAPFAQLLATAELLHVGKGTTFGLGRVAVKSPSNGGTTG